MGSGVLMKIRISLRIFLDLAFSMFFVSQERMLSKNKSQLYGWFSRNPTICHLFRAGSNLNLWDAHEEVN
jgi:hypothetical protein